VLCSGPAQAYRFNWGDLRGLFKLSASVGAAVRMEDRDPALIGKTNLPGQYNFCASRAGGVNCSDVAGNAQYLALPGMANVNHDNGDLNYDQWDLVSAVMRVVPTLNLRYHGIGLNLKAYAFYDPINYDRDDRHPN